MTQGSLGVWQQLKEAAVPVAVYWLCLVYAFAVFCGVVTLRGMASGSFDGGVMVIFACLGVATFGGAGIGQLLAFLRVRTWLVLVFGAMSWGMAFVGIGAMSMAGEIGALIAMILFLLPIALTGGLWSLETHRALWSTWLPLVYTIGAVIAWADWRDTDDRWFAGDKWAIWDVASLGVLGAMVILVLLYLVTRETHRLALWRRGPMAPLRPSREEKGAARPRLTPLGFGLLLGLGVLLTGATALISPYLWRTGPGGDEPDDDTHQTTSRDDGGGASEPKEAGEGGSMEGLKEVAEQMKEAARKAASSLCTMLTLVVLAILGMLIGWRPLKRLAVLRHFRDPLWQVPPTARIEHGWRLVEIAMGDVGVFPRPGEDAKGLATRARPVLEKLSPVEVHGLEDAAEVADRVRFGLGVGPEDVETMRRFSAWAMDTVWERLGDREQVRCMYREI